MHVDRYEFSQKTMLQISHISKRKPTKRWFPFLKKKKITKKNVGMGGLGGVYNFTNITAGCT